MKKQNIVIIGQGEIGKAIHVILEPKHRVSIECWDIDVKACPVKKPLEEIIPKADAVFLCVPSWAIRVAAKDLFEHLKKRTIVVSVSKGIDRDKGKTVDMLLYDVLPEKQPCALLSGPMLAEEMMDDKLSAAVVASKSATVRSYVMQLFNKTSLRLMPTEDMRGAALCGVLKNIYAIGFAVAMASGAGDNYRGYYMMLALEEMGRIVAALGGRPETVYTYAGLGDFVATAFSTYSRNHSYGVALAKKGKVSFESEGSVSVRPLLHLLGKRAGDFCLLEYIGNIVSRKRKPKTILEI